MFGRTDPGECPICGAAHCACDDGGAITLRQLPARDAAAADVEGVPLVADLVTEAPLGDGFDSRPFSTATYRGKKKR